MKNNVILKRADFRHPTREEIKAIKHLIPTLKLFDFKEINELSEIIENKTPLEDINYSNNLYWWNFLLSNRRGMLVHAYEEVLVHYKRGVPDDVKKHTNSDFVNRIQFIFFCETYLYIFSSFKDSLGHLLNVYFKLGINEDRLHFNFAFLEKISDLKIRKFLWEFLIATKEVSEIRNSIAHRYPMTSSDHRTSLSFSGNNPSLGMGTRPGIKPSDLFDKIVKSYYELSTLLDELVSVVK